MNGYINKGEIVNRCIRLNDDAASRNARKDVWSQ